MPLLLFRLFHLGYVVVLLVLPTALHPLARYVGVFFDGSLRVPAEVILVVIIILLLCVALLLILGDEPPTLLELLFDVFLHLLECVQLKHLLPVHFGFPYHRQEENQAEHEGTGDREKEDQEHLDVGSTS